MFESSLIDENYAIIIAQIRYSMTACVSVKKDLLQKVVVEAAVSAFAALC